MTGSAGVSATGDTNMPWDDQNRINKFSILTTRQTFLDDTCKAHTKSVENCNDALNELDMVIDEDEPVKLKIGDVFIRTSIDTCKTQINEHKKTASAHRAEAQSQLAKVTDEMATLKGLLYAKFGDAIQLEAE